MKTDSTFSLVVKLTIRRGEEKFFGPGVAELLEVIAEKGSVKEACRTMGLSYSKGRSILKRSERMLGFPLVLIQHGGQGGGAAVITEEAGRLIGLYRELEKEASEFVRKQSDTLQQMMEKR